MTVILNPGAIDVERHELPHDALIEHCWVRYTEAMRTVADRAVQQHMMTRPEFEAVMNDDRISKWVAILHLDDGTPLGYYEVLGLATMTNELSSWPLVSRSYFRTNFPGREIFYIGLVVTRPRAIHTFMRLISAMYDEVIAADGVAVMDFCGVNVDERRLPEVTDKMLKRFNPHAVGTMIDRQEFWAWDFRPATEKG